MSPDASDRPGERIEDIRALLTSLDHAAPPVSAAAIMAAAEDRIRAQRRRTAVRWAAAVLLTVSAAGVAVAAPGSPVLGWISALVVRLNGEHQPPPSRSRVRVAGESAGIAVPAGERLTIVFTAPAGGVARVSFGEGDQVVVRAPVGAARFATEPERLLIDLVGAADTVAIEIPRAAPRVELGGGGTRLLVAERGHVVPAIAPDGLGRYSVTLPPTAAR